MWELSGYSEAEYTIWGFDGQVLRGRIAAFGAHKIFNFMANAMVTWQTKGNHPYPCRAVFAHETDSGELYLIYAEGKHYGDAPVALKHYAANQNPAHDQDLARSLPDLLDCLKAQAA